MAAKMNIQLLGDQAITLHQKGHLAEAERLYLQMLSLDQQNFLANHLLGVIRSRQGRHPEALQLMGTALAVNPANFDALSNYGNVLAASGRLEEAAAAYDRALAIRPDEPDLLTRRGDVLFFLGRFEDALASYERVLTLSPDHPGALYNRGNCLWQLQRVDEALASYDRVLARNPGHAEAWFNRGNVLRQLKRFDDALASFNRFLAFRPQTVEALNNRAITLRDLGRFDEALAGFDSALVLAPQHSWSLYNRAVTLWDLKRFDEALAAYEIAATVPEPNPLAFGGLAYAALSVCDWPRIAKCTAQMPSQIARKSVVLPFALLGYDSSSALRLECAKNYLDDRLPLRPKPIWTGGGYGHDKIRIAYVSSDFREHPMTTCITELFERHDRTHFEVIGISLGVDDGTAIRARVVASVDRFIDVQAKSDLDVAQLLRELEVDIAIDLNGHTQDARPGIFAHRAVPVQVNYLGYCGSSSADFMDYVLADKITVPFDQQPFFSEQIVHLPDSYWVNDCRRPISATPTRADVGLPEKAFVFCCFNSNWKTTEPIFAIWMRLLAAVPNSVLWLKRVNPVARETLLKEAAARGMDPTRIIFTESTTPFPDHLANHRLADLCLDTLPYNAHTTGCDALWLGLPLITCPGETFASRVAASLLHAVGLPELVTANLADYEALALKLAREPKLLQSIRQKLEANLSTCALFDTDRFRRHIEAAYTQMWQRAEAGEAPQSFAVPTQRA